MGCNESKNSTFENHSSENKPHAATNNSNQTGKVKTDDSHMKTSFHSPSPIDLQDEQNVDILDHGRTVKTATKHSPPKQQKLQNDGGVSNAWASSKNTKTSDHINLIHNVTNVDDESEFGREGIDIYSSSFDGIRKKSSGRSKPKGIQSNDRQIMTSDNVPRLTKKYSEEPFDPTPLIDVDKFKAANIAQKEAEVNNNDAVTIETSTNGALPDGYKTVLSPSNYHEFYDDDEKELMESIEQDFHDTALPGVVT